MNNHTPGPWTLEEHRAHWTSYIVRGGPMQNQIAQCFNWQDKGFDVSSEENARLIAAAPDLLEALELALLVIEATGPGVYHDAERQMRKAIAKAKGETQ